MAELEKTVEFFGIELKVSEVTNPHLKRIVKEIPKKIEHNEIYGDDYENGYKEEYTDTYER